MKTQIRSNATGPRYYPRNRGVLDTGKRRVETGIAITLMALGGAIGGCTSTKATVLPEPPVEIREASAIPSGKPTAAAALPTDRPPTQAPAQRDPPSTQGPVSVEVAPLLVAGKLTLQAEIPIIRSDFGVRFAFSPTEDVLLHSGAGLQIQRVDWERNQTLDAITGFENYPPITISLSPDGSTIVADDGPLIRVWDSLSGAPVQQLQLSPISTIIDAGFQAENLYFAVDYFGNVALWDPNGWGEISRFSSPGRIDSGLLFPGGQAVALQDRDRREVLIFDLEGQKIGSVPIRDEQAELLYGSPQADRIMLHVNRGLPSEGIKILRIDSGESVLDLPLLNFRYFAVSDEWDLLAAMDVFNRLRIYNLPEGELVLEQELEGVVRTLGLAMSPNGSHLAAYVLKGAGEGGAIQIWGAGE
ncbi:MAG: WD40 repeat domain-containing protein [Chloroflexi bacterium]|nr:WD40 repeat domain-containing protein [Chloroflexota bacterium]